jgi:hypothetical protein
MHKRKKVERELEKETPKENGQNVTTRWYDLG